VDTGVEFDKFIDPLSGDYCPDCAHLAQLASQRKGDAQRYIARRLREGTVSDAFLRLVADVVDPDIRKRRGRPRGSSIDDYEVEIAADFEDLLRNGAKYQDAVGMLAEGYAYNERGIGRIVSARVLKPWREMQAWEREYASWSAADKYVYHRDMEGMTDPHEIVDESEWIARLEALADEEAEAFAAMLGCKHQCREGCRRNELTSDRRSCALCRANLTRNVRQ